MTYTQKCPECGSSKLLMHKDKGEVVCKQCGLVVEDRIIDHSQEWQEFDSDKSEKRRRTGAPLSYSVDADEPILIKTQNVIELVKIGDFVDKYVDAHRYYLKKEGIVEYMPLQEKIEAVSFDRNNKINFQTISEVSRHPADEVYELLLESGKRVKVTGSHSVFTVRNNLVVPIKVDELKEGEFVVAPLKLPCLEQEQTVNILDKFMEIADNKEFYRNIYVRNITDPSFFMSLKECAQAEKGINQKIKNWRRHKTVPIYILKKFKESISIKTFNCPKVCIGTYSGRNTLPLELPITSEFCRLLGFYASEGDSDKYVVRFSFGAHEKEYIKEVEKCIQETFGFKIGKQNPHSSATQLSISSKLLAIFFKEILKTGANATNKRVPPMIYAATTEHKTSFLKSYIDGDGCYIEKYNTQRPDIAITTTSVNPNLSNDVLALYGTLGIHAHYGTEMVKERIMEKTGQIMKASLSTKTIIKNPDTAKRLGYLAATTKPLGKPAIEMLIPAPIEYRKEWKFRSQLRISKEAAIKIARKYNDKNLLKLATADFIYLRLRKIKKCKSTNGYAYDISVPGYENFVGGIGGIFLHNSRYDQGLGTDIGQRGDLFQLEGKGMNKFFRLRKWQYRISTAIERNLKLALAELKRVSSYLKLPKSVEEEAARVYTMAVQRGLVRGRSMESVVAGALYAACRRHEVPRTLDELSEASGIDKKEVGRTYRFITRELGIRILPSNPVDYIPRFASALKLSAETQSKSVEILEMAENSELTSGRGPTGIAAASLYVAALLNNEKRTQREVADIAGVTEVTIRNRYKELFNKLKLKDKLKGKK